MRTCPLLHNIRHRTMITAVGALCTNVIRINQNYWTIIVRFKLLSNVNCPLDWNSICNVLCKSIDSKIHSIWYELYFKKCLIAKGSGL